jgi:hypothetical protein
MSDELPATDSDALTDAEWQEFQSIQRCDEGDHQWMPASTAYFRCVSCGADY